MANTYFWVIAGLECYPEKDGLQDVVFRVHWRRQATDGKGHNGDVYGMQSLTLDPDQPFTPYSSLTKEQVTGWLDASMSAEEIAALDAALDAQIEAQINPPVVAPPLPWVG